ncbi:hypothetical protein [Enterococcus sp. AZ050]|uniref:hypothetical protein n=1 Tax=Enterococcus sp. AZ050 TaxID=2774696 RepID=UPI003F68BD1C
MFHIRLEELQEIEKLYFSKNIAAKKIIEQEKEALMNKQAYILYPVQTWQLYFYSRYRLKSLRMSVLKQKIEKARAIALAIPQLSLKEAFFSNVLIIA